MQNPTERTGPSKAPFVSPSVSSNSSFEAGELTFSHRLHILMPIILLRGFRKFCLGAEIRFFIRASEVRSIFKPRHVMSRTSSDITPTCGKTLPALAGTTGRHNLMWRDIKWCGLVNCQVSPCSYFIDQSRQIQACHFTSRHVQLSDTTSFDWLVLPQMAMAWLALRQKGHGMM